MNPAQTILAKVPDCDDALRRLADVLKVPATCRRRACRHTGHCQGGYGPPCFLAERTFFADALRDRMHEFRDHWASQRSTLETILRR